MEGGRVRYLFGDSTEADLEFSFLSLIREVVDCAVVMLQAEASLTVNNERRRSKEDETAGLIRAVEELGKEASALVDPIAKEQAKVPVGRFAASIATAIRESVERESAQAKSALLGAREEIDRDSQKVRANARAVLEKLLRNNDLPGAEKEYDVTWAGGVAKATMRQRTAWGLDVVLELDANANPLLVHDLRVDRIDPALEVHVHEAGGWGKKRDKLVQHKLGRYQVVRVSAGADTTILLKSVPDGTGLTIIVKRGGTVLVEGTGGNAGKEFEPDERDTGKLQQFAEKLAGSLRGLQQRTGLVSADVDQKPLAEHEHPKVLADRLIAAIAPSVQKLSKHSLNAQELVLRRQLADDRREEMYISVAELVKKIDVLPPPAQSAFAPLQLPGIPSATARSTPIAAPMPAPKPAEPEPKPIEAKPAEARHEAKPEEPKPMASSVPAVLPSFTSPRPKTPSAVPLVAPRDKPKTVPPPGELREPATKPTAITIDADEPGD